jgi:hypothetical protein
MKFKILFLLLLASFVVNGQDTNIKDYGFSYKSDTIQIDYYAGNPVGIQQYVIVDDDPGFMVNLPNIHENEKFITKPNYVDPEVKRLIQGLKNDYQYQIDALKLRIEALENSENSCDCCQYELKYYDIGQNYEWIKEDGSVQYLTIPELYLELPDACIGAKAIIFMFDYTLYLEFTAQDGWNIFKAVKVAQ